jgi:hypothetical protein
MYYMWVFETANQGLDGNRAGAAQMMDFQAFTGKRIAASNMIPQAKPADLAAYFRLTPSG